MKKLRFILSSLALLLVVGFFLFKTANPPRHEIIPVSSAAQEAPDFPKGMEWLNTEGPLSLKDLRGKVVLLDFWTYCCINCMHVIPDLKKLEAKYTNELVVIGVHSAKFTGEKETQNIREAIMRYELVHPVVNDKDMRVWDAYGVHAWPTMVLIDPAGKIVGGLSGEGIYEPLDELIGQVAADFDKRGLLNKKPLKLSLEKDRVADGDLSFPGKVLADEASGRLFISDSNHNRIIVSSLDGEVLQVIGSGEIGLTDGAFEKAAFNHPQGLALKDEILYVADTENHAIRKIDLKNKMVTTPARSLNSPWDLLVQGPSLYIAMAGPHQLWKMDLKSGKAEPYAGSGREARIDGLLSLAALAQPSGITTDGKKLYFADSETSSIRSADLTPGGKVETIVGLDLFEFGDRDGTGDEVRLQHPLGVLYHDGRLYVADTYNDKIKVIEPGTKKTSTFLSSGFNEPGGLSVAGGKLFVADTNNHAIRVADLKTKQVSVLELKNLTSPVGAQFIAPLQTIRAGETKLLLSVVLPPGHKLNAQAPSRVELTATGEGLFFEGESQTQMIQKPEFPLMVPVIVAEGEGRIKAHLVLYHCEEKKESLCYFHEVNLDIPVNGVTTGGAAEIKVPYTVPFKR